MPAICSAVEQQVTRTIAAHDLWRGGERRRVVAAVSGGADSLCLLGVLLALQQQQHPLAPAEIIVAHLDHGIRGAASAADARFVAELAARLGLRCVTDQVDVPALARAHHRSVEAAARGVRYAFLLKTARTVEALTIYTGHTSDDQVETLVQHWLRGSGLAGLVGMPYRQGEWLMRPLLDVSRADTEAYCAALGWTPRHDETNDDTRYQRNAIRHDLLPQLERFNPNLRATLLRNAQLIAADEAYLVEQAYVASQALLRSDLQDHRRVVFALPGLRALPPALRHRVLRRTGVLLAFSYSVFEARHIALLDEWLTIGHAGDTLDLPAGITATLGYDTITFTKDRPTRQFPTVARRVLPPEPVDTAVALPVPGVAELPTLGWRVRAWLQDLPAGIDSATGGTAPPPADVPSFAQARNDLTTELQHAETRVYLDADMAGDGLSVRVWRPGDRFQPFGMRGTKKLQDFFADAKVPRAQRATVPLVVGHAHLLWIAGLRLDDRVRLTPQTQRVLVLQLERLPEPD